MQELDFVAYIDATPEVVWDTMLEADTYEQWTAPFFPGSYYEGDWNEGSEIRFLARDDDGQVGGMISRIRMRRHPEFLAIEHLGIVRDGVDDLTSGEAVSWAGAREEYTFHAVDGGTQLRIVSMVGDAEAEMMRDGWERALGVLKPLAERAAVAR